MVIGKCILFNGVVLFAIILLTLYKIGTAILCENNYIFSQLAIYTLWSEKTTIDSYLLFHPNFSM